MTNAPTLTEKSKKQRDNTLTPKNSITQQFRTDLGRPVGVAANPKWDQVSGGVSGPFKNTTPVANDYTVYYKLVR